MFDKTITKNSVMTEIKVFIMFCTNWVFVYQFSSSEIEKWENCTTNNKESTPTVL